VERIVKGLFKPGCVFPRPGFFVANKYITGGDKNKESKGTQKVTGWQKNYLPRFHTPKTA